ncbi:MAG: single-stranded DNA-binding protein [Marmoricola sp.]
MTSSRSTATRLKGREDDPDDPANTVSLRGRLSSAPVVRELPSGDALVTFRLTVPRRSDPSAGARRATDWFDCAVWGGRVLRTSQGWAVGDRVEISGELRRRHFRSGAGVQTRVEVVVRAGRRVRRADA